MVFMMITKIFDREKDNEKKSTKRPTGGMVTVKLTYTYISEVYEAFVNLEESFREGPFYAQITQNLLLYLWMFHE